MYIMSSSQEEQSKDTPSKDEKSKETESRESSGSSNKPPSIIYGPSAPEPLSMTFGELLDYHAETRPDKPAVISHVQDKTISFKKLRLGSIQLARAFSADGIGKGDLVAISLGSRIEYFEVSLCPCLSIPIAADIQSLLDVLCLRIFRSCPRASKLCLHRNGDDQTVEDHK